MGDAGPATPVPGLDGDGIAHIDLGLQNEPAVREVKILVTGFGPFKSFAINPSWLIASSLPAVLEPLQTTEPLSQQLPRAPKSSQSCKINLVVHPSPIRVAYATVATTIPELLAQHNPDYIFHIGMAGGRNHYTLETIAHRDGYKIKDVDERDGWKEGEFAWKKEGVPENIHVGWDEEDVLKRWEEHVWAADDKVMASATPQATSSSKNKGRSVVKLSRDAGRFLCEFILFTSLSRRWLEANQKENEQPDEDSVAIEARKLEARGKLGKVAFLHVPGGHNIDDVRRGTRVAEAAIRAFVESWEDGKRRVADQEEKLDNQMLPGRWEGVVWKG